MRERASSGHVLCMNRKRSGIFWQLNQCSVKVVAGPRFEPVGLVRMSAAMTAELITDALVMPIWWRGRPRELLHHSDRGAIYERGVPLADGRAWSDQWAKRPVSPLLSMATRFLCKSRSCTKPYVSGRRSVLRKASWLVRLFLAHGTKSLRNNGAQRGQLQQRAA